MEDYQFIDAVKGIGEIAERILPEAYRYIEKLKRTLLEFELEYRRIPGGSDFDGVAAERLAALIKSFQSGYVQSLDALFSLYLGSDLRNRCEAFRQSATHDFEDLDVPPIGVKIEKNNGALYVKMPPLLCNVNQEFAAGGRLIRRNYSHFYAREIDRIMRNNSSEFGDFGKRNINVLALYSNLKPAIPDTLNLDLKCAVDAITNSMLGGDAWNVCSFSLASAICKEVPEGVYFTVSEGFAKSPNFDENLQMLILLFG